MKVTTKQTGVNGKNGWFIFVDGAVHNVEPYSSMHVCERIAQTIRGEIKQFGKVL